eukprot:GHVT01061565.1.p1 GENE.GHVT01061565.1~~GHVT01061565.1.p1  ORF type:complete len:230 (+),score=48.82 GHVT01061565.1:180-869(+)
MKRPAVASPAQAEDDAKRSAVSQLDRLKKMTTVVGDTGEVDQINRLKPEDATTNPTLILKAAKMESYNYIIKDTFDKAKASGSKGEELQDEICDRLVVAFGIAILKVVPGLVSTEVDAALSFDTAGSIAKARRLIGLFEEEGVARSRVLIKLATTWESCQAAKVLEAEGIHCNLTLLFSMAQVAAGGNDQTRRERQGGKKEKRRKKEAEKQKRRRKRSRKRGRKRRSIV